MTDLVERLKAACALVRSPGTGQGTGYLVSARHLATCHHVVEGAGKGGEVSVELGGHMLRGNVLDLDKDTDVAIVELVEPPPGLEPLPLAGACERRAQWDGYGYPALAKSAGVPFFGVVLDPNSSDDLHRPMMTLYSDMVAAGMAAPVHGLSGGPVLVNGMVVGHFSRILSTQGATGQPALGLVYAARAEKVAALLGTAPPPPSTSGPQALSFGDLVPKIGRDEYHVFVCYRSADRAFAVRLQERLEAVGFRVFLDQREGEVDANAAQSVRDALARSRAGLVLVGQKWRDSRPFRLEVETIVARAKAVAGFRLVALRLDTADLPSGITTAVDASVPAGRPLEHIVYTLLGVLPPPDGSSERKARETLTDATDAALRHLDAAVLDPTRFRSVLKLLETTGLLGLAPIVRAAEALIGAGRHEAALRILPKGDSLRAIQLRALALSKLGRSQEALALLEPPFRAGQCDVETGGILGTIYMDAWYRVKDHAFLLRALEVCRVTYAATCQPESAVDVAALQLLLGRRDESRLLAEKVVQQLGAKRELGAWRMRALAEAFLILERMTEATEWYERATAAFMHRPQDLASMRREARLLLPKLGRKANALDGVLPVPRVVAFVGIETDDPGRALPRFPEKSVELVRREIRKRLVTLGGRVHGVSSAARGGDLLFLEEVLQHQGTASVFLPVELEAFRERFVDTEWLQRFDDVASNERVEIMVEPGSEDGALPAFTKALLERAEGLGGRFDDAQPVLFGLHDEANDVVTGAIEYWSVRGKTAEVILLHELPTAASLKPGASLRPGSPRSSSPVKRAAPFIATFLGAALLAAALGAWSLWHRSDLPTKGRCSFQGSAMSVHVTGNGSVVLTDGDAFSGAHAKRVEILSVTASWFTAPQVLTRKGPGLRLEPPDRVVPIAALDSEYEASYEIRDEPPAPLELTVTVEKGGTDGEAIGGQLWMEGKLVEQPMPTPENDIRGGRITIDRGEMSRPVTIDLLPKEPKDWPDVKAAPIIAGPFLGPSVVEVKRADGALNCNKKSYPLNGATLRWTRGVDMLEELRLNGHGRLDVVLTSAAPPGIETSYF